MRGLAQFRRPPATLPAGPKAILTLGGGGARPSRAHAIASANTTSIPISDVGYAGWHSYPEELAETRALGEKNGRSPHSACE